MKFHIAEKINLPENAVTQTFGFFGRKGSGKTYAAGVLAESFLSAGVQVVVLDPVGNWYGLRLSRTGKSESPFHIPILGGERGDIPLQTTGAALVAQTIVETGTSAVLDVSHFRKAERKRFMADFAEELFHRKKTNRSPMHLVIEEAQLFAPQMTKGEERMLGAIEDLVRLGRNYGIGCSMISQRPQSINTEVRNQCEPLIVFQLVAKHERDAIKGWMEHMGVGAELEELSKLKTGECFFWSPAWLDKFVRTQFGQKVSFDASSTPTLADGTKRPGKLKSLDLGKLQTAMAATIEEAKANDPAELKKQVAELKRQLAAKAPAAPDPKASERAAATAVAERDRFWRGELAKAEKAHGSLATRLTKINQLSTLNGDVTMHVAQPADTPVNKTRTFPENVQPRQRIAKSASDDACDVRLGGGALRMVQVLADRHPAQFTEAQWATMSGLKRTGGTWSTYKSRITMAGFVVEDRGMWRASEKAVAEFGDPSRAPQTPDELLADWKSKLGSGSARMLDALWEGPKSRQELAAAVEIEMSGGTFGTYLSRLRSNGLVNEAGGQLQLSEAFA